MDERQKTQKIQKTISVYRYENRFSAVRFDIDFT